MADFATRYGADCRAFVERLLSFASTPGDEAAVQAFVRGHLDALGFETYEWTADPERLADHDSFPDDPAEISTTDRPSVAGVLELGSGKGRTLVLNGHVDVVPARYSSGGEERASDAVPANERQWESDPFTPTWDGEDLTARGAADMKSGLAACVYAARALGDRAEAGEVDVDGRVVVESVAGEEEGGIGAAAAALDSPYPFGRDAAIIAEPTELTPVVASEGSLMVELELTGRSAHAATRWRGESVLPHFERVRAALDDFETEREESVTHPLYEAFPVAWPVVVGTVRAGEWASTVPDHLVAEARVGVAPGETVAEVETALREHLASLADADPWLADHLSMDRSGIQFEASEISPDEPVVRAVQAGMATHGLADDEPRGVTYGADARHYVEAGVPTVLFGPGSIEEAHFPDETIHWPDVERAGAVLSAAAAVYLSS
ncbi:M20/M25/M40 family metallo-hydrolase [Halomarina litorea]|uniref:M20/M25/M40 family metallo-hydrolase n=1 Tax=Halomarina litorea TaxID=2961595 RepID=UPI0020C32C9D|nr:M20/M25/M40 family metallo-hydrolase [Halomarina sp. BCD28]